MPTNATTLALMGDVFIDRDDPTETLRMVKPLLADSDVILCNSEGVYSEEAPRPPSTGHQIVTRPRNAEGLQFAGVDAVSCANNHIVDGGHIGLLNTLKKLRSLGIQTAGAGPDLATARKPAFIDKDGIRVALLAYSCVYPMGYEARETTPGLVPLRVDTAYVPANPHYWAPGSPPRAVTKPWDSDLQEMRRDIDIARDGADLVVVSIHWGNSFMPFALNDYERVLGRYAVDAGADVVMGHHHHSLRGAEIYNGKPIFYGLGNFAFDLRDVEKRWNEPTRAGFRERYGEYAFGPREEYPAFPFHETYRYTTIATVLFNGSEFREAGFIPCIVRPDGPEPLPPGHPERESVVRHLRRAMDVVGENELEDEGSISLAGVTGLKII